MRYFIIITILIKLQIASALLTATSSPTSLNNTTNASSNASTAPITSTAVTSTAISSTSLPKSEDPHEPNFDKVNVSFTFSVSLVGLWNDSLKDSSSDNYKSFHNSVYNDLHEIYVNYSSDAGFLDLAIFNFTEGSIIVYYYTIFNADIPFKNYSQLNNSLYEVYKILNNSLIDGLEVNKTYLNENMPGQIAKTYDVVQSSKSDVCFTVTDLCYPYEKCSYDNSLQNSSGIVCTPRCHSSLKACKGTQNCYYSNYTETECRCDVGYVLINEKCSSIWLIIGLSAGIGLVIIIILVIVIACACKKKKNLDKPKYYKQSLDQFDDAFNNSQSTNNAYMDTEVDRNSGNKIIRAEKSKSSSNIDSYKDTRNTLPAEDLTEYRPSLAVVNTNTKFVLKRPAV